MASTQKFKARIDFRRRGNVPAPRFRLAVREALRDIAQPLLNDVKRLAAQRVKHSPSRTNRGGLRYAKRMVDAYEVDVLADGKTLSLRNPLLRARIFELGSRAHPIPRTPRQGKFIFYRSPKPMGPLHRRVQVNHPGTQAQHIMRDAMTANRGRMTDNLKDAINNELHRRGE